jgi:hypothetical protein
MTGRVGTFDEDAHRPLGAVHVIRASLTAKVQKQRSTSRKILSP